MNLPDKVHRESYFYRFNDGGKVEVAAIAEDSNSLKIKTTFITLPTWLSKLIREEVASAYAQGRSETLEKIKESLDSL